MGRVSFKIILFFLRFSAAVLSLYLLSAFIDIKSSLIYAAAIPIIASAIALNIASAVTDKKKALFHKYNRQSFAFVFVKSRTFAYIATIIIALFLSFFVPVKLYLSSGLEKVALLLVVPVYIIVSLVAKAIGKHVYSESYRSHGVKRITYGVSAVIAGAIYPISVYFIGGYDGAALSLKDIGDAAFANLVPLEHSPIAFVLGYFLSFFDSLSVFIIRASSEGALYVTFAVLISFAGNGLFFYALINYVGAFMLRKDEIKDVFTPIEPKKDAAGVNKFVVAFMFTLVTLFIYPAVFAFVQGMVKDRSQTFDYVREKTKVAVEIIDGAAYKIGTLRAIELTKASLYGKSRTELEEAINKTYDEMAGNTDKYLDWYYSLGAEYTRIYKLITGSIDEYMESKLRRTIAPTAGLNEAFSVLKENAANVQTEVEKILAKNKVDMKDSQYKAALNVNLDSVYKKSEVSNIINLKERLFASAGVSLAAGAIAGAAASKIAAKTTFKTAAKAAAKLAAQKGAGAAIGLAAGAVSSIFTSPLGGVAIGAATGLALDKGMLKLEETVNREEYKNEIISAIDSSRRDTLNAVAEAFDEK